MTQNELMNALHYNEVTGYFTWKVSNNNRIKIGDRAGYTSKRSGYTKIKINRKLYQAHRLAWLYIYGVSPTKEIDHIDHIRTNNSISNLREVTRQENSKNARIRSNNSSGVTGISWFKQTFRWHVQIHDLGGNSKHIGYYINFEDARKARKSAEQEYNYHENHGGN
ncbi:MAG: HNH endonuclease signature motif containing protein [Methylophagaceae bacterium]